MERSFGNKYGKWIVTAVVVLLLGLWFYSSSGVESYADKYKDADLTQIVEGIGRDNTYELYLQAHADAADAAQDIVVDLASVAPGEKITVNADGTVLTETGSSATWTVDVPADGFYNVELSYLAETKEGIEGARGVDIERGILIDGQLPFDGADTMTFTRLWTDKDNLDAETGDQLPAQFAKDENGADHSVKVYDRDNQGNEIRPTQKEIVGVAQTAYCRDAMGYETQPYRFFLTQGKHEITLVGNSEPIVLTALTLKAPVAARTYEAYLADVGEHEQPEELKGYTLILEGEHSVRRSSPSLYARYDRSSPATVPSNVRETVMNYIGGDPWRDAGQWIEWDFQVPQDGWYNITIKGRQTYSRGSISARIVYLDGEILFDGMENVAFPYDTNWQMKTLADDKGEAYSFYLTADKPHTIRLEATLGDMGPVLADMEESIYRLNQMYRKILVLTGVTPDQYRDYHLESTYPEVIEAMALESKLLYKLVDDTVAVTGQKSDRIAVAQTLAIQLEEFVEDPAEITAEFTNFKDNVTSMGTSMQNLRQVKMDVDQIIITAQGTSVGEVDENFFSKAWHEVESCVASYTVDYNALGNVDTTGEALEVWILTGRDQSTVLKKMIDEDFSKREDGVPVNVMLVDPNALLNAVVAGNGPDVVVSTDSWNPVNYAMRGAAEDLTQFPDWQDVLCEENFYPSAYEAFKYTGRDGEEGIYALPETQLCSILFYRKDILEEYELEVPKTWDALIAMMPTIQGSNMSVGIPYPDITAPNLSVLYSMIYQRGGAIYNEDATATEVNSEAGVAAFETYTSLYNDYGLPTIFDFLSRFRSGEMPMGIFDYTTFNTLAVSAPEIRGLWDIAVLPGTIVTDENGEPVLDENGEPVIDHKGHSQGACCMMIATDDEKVKQNAWSFMKWWVSADTQAQFGREIEAVLGSSARYATANRQAIKRLAWSEEQLEVIESQMAVAVGFREIAGGYYTTRHLTNAVRKVTNDKTDARETLLDYARTIDEEIQKKRSEFGLPDPKKTDAPAEELPVAGETGEAADVPPAPDAAVPVEAPVTETPAEESVPETPAEESTGETAQEPLA